MTAPVEHLQEGQKLTADALVDLWEIQVRGSSSRIRFKNSNTSTWQGNEYEGMACSLSGESRSADDSQARPTLTIVNPDGIFSPFVVLGTLDFSTVIRKRVLRQHLEANQNIFQQSIWLVGRVAKLNHQTITLELRSTTDGPNFVVPARMYLPPEFPVVNL